jgi:hypothetical protein
VGVLDELVDGEGESVMDDDEAVEDEVVGTVEAPTDEGGWPHPERTIISPIPTAPIRWRGRRGWFMWSIVPLQTPSSAP